MTGAAKVAWLALLSAALLLRAWGLGIGAPPIRVHPDELHYAGIAEELSWADLNPHYFENPPLLTYILFGASEIRAAAVGDEAHREWVRTGGLFRLGRWLSVLSGVLTVLLVGAACRRLTGREGAGFAAGVVVAFSFLHGRDSHYGVNDVPMVALLSLCLYWAVRAYQGDGVRWARLSAVAAGLAASMKYTGAMGVALPLTAIVLHARRADRGRASGPWLLEAVLLGALALAAFVATTPFSVLDFPEFRTGFVRQWSTWGDKRWMGQLDRPGALLYAGATLDLLGWANVAAAVAGLVLLLRRKSADAVLLLVVPVLYLALMLNKTLFFWRFALPLLPFPAIAAGIAWDALSRRVSGARAATPALACLLVLGNAEPASKLIRHDQLCSRPQTWFLARDWILEHVPPRSNLFLEGLPPRFPYGRYKTFLPDTHLDTMHRISRTEPDGSVVVPIAQGGWVATDTFVELGLRMQGGNDKQLDFYRRLRENFQPVVEFTPGPSGDPTYVVDAQYSPLFDLWAVDRPGFTIRIYRVGPMEWGRIFGL